MKPLSTLIKMLAMAIMVGLATLPIQAAWSADLSAVQSWAVEGSNKESSIHLKEALKKFKKKGEVVVAVIDTGIDPTHPFLISNVWLPNNAKISAHNFGRDFSKTGKSPNAPLDQNGHGTHIAGIIKSVYSDVKILSLKYFDPMGSGEDNLNSTIKALKFAVDSRVDIINYSGGGPESSEEEKKLLEKAESMGILVVAASGNESANIDDGKKNAYYPASYKLPNIITVTAHDKNLRILSSSNYGKVHVDISAPGDRIKSSLPSHRAGFLTGTSQATAFVSGVAALLKAQNPELKARDLKKLIMDSANKMDAMASLNASGGILNAEKALSIGLVGQQDVQKTLALSTDKEDKKSPGRITYRRLSSKPTP